MKPRMAAMKVGIVCAGDDELAPFLPVVEKLQDC